MPLFSQRSFNIQHELARNLLLQVGYVGTKGVSLPNRYDANQASQFDPVNPQGIQTRKPYRRVGFVSANTSQTYSNYNGLDVRLERRAVVACDIHLYEVDGGPVPWQLLIASKVVSLESPRRLIFCVDLLYTISLTKERFFFFLRLTADQKFEVRKNVALQFLGASRWPG